MAGTFNLIIKEGDRDLHVNARAVASFTICIYSAAMPNGFERIDACLHNLAAWLAINRNHKTHTTAGVFFSLRIHAIFSHTLPFGFLSFHPACIEFRHGGLLSCPERTLFFKTYHAEYPLKA
jgi:hypothetical protein